MNTKNEKTYLALQAEREEEQWMQTKVISGDGKHMGKISTANLGKESKKVKAILKWQGRSTLKLAFSQIFIYNPLSVEKSEGVF